MQERWRSVVLHGLFYKLNVRTKKDSYPLPWVQEAIKNLFGAGYFSCLDLMAGFWQIAINNASKQYTAFTMGNLGFFECESMLFGLCHAPATFQRLMQGLPGQTEHDLLPNLLGWQNCLFEDRGWALTSPAHCVQVPQRVPSEAQANKVQGRHTTQQREPESCGRIHSTPNLQWNGSIFGAW